MSFGRASTAAVIMTLCACEPSPPAARLDRRVEVRLDAGVDAAPEPGCLGPAGDPRTAGPCGCSSDCGPGELCLTEQLLGIGGGLCDLSCDVDDDCPEGFACIWLEEDDPATGLCLVTCTTTDDCRAGLACNRVRDSTPLTCNAMCQDDADCPVTGSCDEYTTSCGDLGVHPGEGDIGDPCESNSDCISGNCIVRAEVPGGYCTTTCSYTRQGCPEGASCIPQFGPEEDLGACFRSCQRRSDCREAEGYVCALDERYPDYPVCYPAP